MRPMTKILVAFVIVVGPSLLVATPAPRTFEGQIMDSTCAKAGNHDAGYKMTNTNTPKACTLACAQAGSKFVLYDPASKTTYQLDDQSKAKEYAGEKVNVTGTYNAKTGVIHVEKLQPAS